MPFHPHKLLSVLRIIHIIYRVAPSKDTEGYAYRMVGIALPSAYGDGCYEDDHGNCYGVDAGVIGLVPLELVKIADPESVGTVIHEPGTAHFEASDGKYLIVTPGGSTYEIDTSDDSSDDEEEEDW